MFEDSSVSLYSLMGYNGVALNEVLSVNVSGIKMMPLSNQHLVTRL